MATFAPHLRSIVLDGVFVRNGDDSHGFCALPSLSSLADPHCLDEKHCVAVGEQVMVTIEVE